MSDSEDDSSFVEVVYQSSSDSEWERIDSDREEEEQLDVVPELVVKELPAGENISVNPPQESGTTEQKEVKKSRSQRRRKVRRAKEDIKRWERVTTRKIKGVLTPEDPVESLGITVEDASVLAFYSVFTIGQLAFFDVKSQISANDENFARLLDLQEQASEIATEYVTKISDNSALWAYCYLRESELVEVLQNGYLESNSLLFLWSPIPNDLLVDCLAIDRIIGKERKDPSISDRYSRLVKLNLMKLCELHDAKLYVKEGKTWLPIRVTEVDAWTAKEDMWNQFEPGTDVFASVPHGKLVVPSGQVPLECVVFDCPLPRLESEDDDEQRDHPYAQYIPRREDVVLGTNTLTPAKCSQTQRRKRIVAEWQKHLPK